MVLSTDWTQLEVIDLINDGTGLGFGIIGGRSTGVVVKTLLPGGIADQDGHLRTGDHILQIGDINVRGMGSEQVALVLRQSGPHVRLVVARPILEAPLFQIPHAPIIPTHQLDQHMEHFNAVMAMELGDHELQLHNLHLHHQLQQYQLQQYQLQQHSLLGSVQVHPLPLEMMQDVPNIDVFEVDLVKENTGLGITIAGYVGGDSAPDEISGIFVKSVVEGSTAALDGRIQVNDQIIEVDGRSLQGFSNHQAVEVLKNTDRTVRLKLVRFTQGPKFEKLQEYLAQATQVVITQPVVTSRETTVVSGATSEQHNLQDGSSIIDDYSGDLSADVEAAIKASWEPIVGTDFHVVVAQLAKFKEAGGLGISLEGTVDVENGVEVRPHHYIRSILPDGPVGLNGRLKSSDELLEVNGKLLLGLNHVNVVDILKDLPQNVRLVCARRKVPLPDSFIQPDMQMPATSPYLAGIDLRTSSIEKLIKAKSEVAIPRATESQGQWSHKPRSRSLEPLTSMAMWDSQATEIQLEKGDKGLGFSVIDYRDPSRPNENIIVVRSLVPGGVAQLDGRLMPGDRLVFVNDVRLERATQAEAARALKAAARGIVRIGVAKLLPLRDVFQSAAQTSPLTEGSSLLQPMKRIPPALTPKPEDPAQLSSLLVSVHKKEPASPVPATSPPPFRSTPTPPLTPPLRPAPCSPKRTDLESKLRGRSGIIHRQASSTPSSEYMTSSDLKTPPSSPRLLYSGQPGFASPELARISASLERTLHIHKGHLHLGLAVETVDKGINGCMVKSIAKPSAVERDGRIRLGDYIVSINNESLRRVTNAQARAIFRRSSLLGSDVTITYIPGEAVEKLQQTEGYTTSPRNSPQKFAQSLKSHDAAVSMATEQSQVLAEEATAAAETPAARQASPPEAKSGMVSGQKTLQTDGSTAVGNQMWGPARIVQLVREPGRSLGISIVGGRVDMFNVSQEHSNAGIFIKQVISDSPAGRNGTLKKGDRILECYQSTRNLPLQARFQRENQVSGCDVRNATHDEAVEAIRNSPNLITFVVQSLSYSPCQPNDLESSPVKSVQSFKKAALRTESSSPSSPEPSSHQVDVKMSDSVTDSESEDEFGYTKKHIKKKYLDLPGTLHLVDLNRGTSGIGLGLAGNKDRSKMSVFVAGIQPESAAARDGRILVGDELLEISGVNLQGLSHLNASAVIKGVTTPIVKLVIHRREDFLDHMAIKPLTYGGSSQFDVQPISAVSPRGSADTGTSSSSNSRRESSATSYSHSSSVAPPAASPSSAQSLTPLDVVQVITLQKASCQGLGFGIHEDTKNGRRGIYVNSITQGGIADQDQQLEVGDEILEVEDKSLAGLHYEKAIELLRAAQGSVRLKVRKAGSITNVGLTTNAVSDNTQGKMQLLNTLGESSTDHIESSEGGDPKTCPIAPGRCTYIEIEKGKIGLGVGIVGGSDTLLNAILISEIYDNGAAARDGRLCVGDQILEVNGEDFTDAAHASALQILRQTPSIVKMAVYRDEIRAAEEETLDVFSVELIRRPGKGLGLSIMGKKNAAGVCISDIVKGGTAEADGRLMHGDQILAVNGEDIRTSTQDHVATILKTIMGKVHLSMGRLRASSKASSKSNSNYGISLKKSESSVSSKPKGKHSKSIPSSKSY